MSHYYLQRCIYTTETRGLPATSPAPSPMVRARPGYLVAFESCASCRVDPTAACPKLVGAKVQLFGNFRDALRDAEVRDAVRFGASVQRSRNRLVTPPRVF